MAGPGQESSPARPSIDVVMAAFGGASYISAQITSILNQSDTDWLLTVRDDRSTDGTYAIAESFSREHPDRVVARQRGENSGSARQNFLEMLLETTAPYVMFADDDDVWLADKVAITRRAMQELEGRFGADTPLLVHTDLTVTDRELTVLATSMARYQGLDGRESRLSRLVVQNTATGCTVMVNRALADLVRQPFDHVVMHDWWLLLIAAAFGQIGYVSTPTVLHRQHGQNAVGAIDAASARYNVRRLLDTRETRRRAVDSSRQAEAFLRAFEDRLTPAQAEMLRAYVALPSLSKAARIRALRRHGFWKNTLVRRLGQLLFV